MPTRFHTSQMWCDVVRNSMYATLDTTALEFRDRLAGDDMRELCPDARLILDVGAGEGTFARQARIVWPNARIISFEPASRFNQTLQPIDDLHTVIRKCVGAFSGSTELQLTHGRQSNSVLPFLPDGPLCKVHAVVGTETVEQVRLDDMSFEGRVDILKMDVQGAELMVLEGARNLLKSKPVIYTEVSFQPLYRNHPLLADVDACLAGYGYRRLYLYASPMPDLWGDAIYMPDTEDLNPIRLNIGAGKTVIPGFTPIDRKLGTEAFPLNYADNTVEEIRCVHMLEHLSFGDVAKALKEWNRVLRPGGRLRISVPDVEKVLEFTKEKTFDTHWMFYLMGGQTDADDFHKSAFDGALLAAHMEKAGFVNPQPWKSTNTDLASADFSLNLEAFKPVEPRVETQQELKVRACIGMPRIGWNDAWQSICDATRPFRIPVETHQGCFWAQNIHKAFVRAVNDGIDWLITLDYDSMIMPCHIQRLLEIMGTHPEIDACAALQMRRGEETPLLSTGKREHEFEHMEPFKVNTAHFGLTIIRVECLKDLAKPWLIDQPDKDGEYAGDHVDADIYFWNKWRDAGKTVYIAPDVRIGHLELVVSEYDDELKPRHYHIAEWWSRHARAGHCMRSKKED